MWTAKNKSVDLLYVVIINQVVLVDLHSYIIQWKDWLYSEVRFVPNVWKSEILGKKGKQLWLMALTDASSQQSLGCANGHLTGLRSGCLIEMVEMFTHIIQTQFLFISTRTHLLRETYPNYFRTSKCFNFVSLIGATSTRKTITEFSAFPKGIPGVSFLSKHALYM